MPQHVSYELEALRESGELILYRGHETRDRSTVLVVAPLAEQPSPQSLRQIAHEWSLAADLDPAWAARPVEVARRNGRTMLILQDPGGEPLERILERAEGQPLDTARAIRIAAALAMALGRVHAQGLIHKDIKPANVLVDDADRVWLTGFGIASRLPRESQPPTPPEIIAGTLAYMAPEQTGRMNRSLDTRSDLYSLGVTVYRMLTGALPFSAVDPLEWVHCHIARQPAPPHDRAGVPEPLSRLTMKLLAKNAEDRYQTAAGVEADLRQCLADWQAAGRLDPFPLGTHDTSDRLRIPEKLYGREREIEALLAVFDRVMTDGTSEVVLVSGYAGAGKSSVVNELHKALTPRRGLFASGKFDQYKRDIPYAPLTQAFQGLIRPLLGHSEADLLTWREAFSEALGPNARLMVELVPELKLIVGEPPLLPDLTPQDARLRFQLAFRQFVDVLARPEHPLVLFLDDLQWLDAATLDVLEHLLTQRDVRHLMLIGAYRTNEVTNSDALVRRLDAIRHAGLAGQEIRLAPLAHDDVERLIADALRVAPQQATALAHVVHEKTGGNPFFVIQFLSALADQGVLIFDRDHARWTWDLDRVHALGYTDNVVDLMVGKLVRLSATTQKALQQLACVGNTADFAMLSTAFGVSEERVHADLAEAVRLELVQRLETSYTFVHDRIQEAAYSLIPDASRAPAHLQIGRYLAARTAPEKQEEAIFEIVSQLNRGTPLITSHDEREQLAALNLLAGTRAHASTAYASALAYFAAGTALLADDSWERRHDLTFALELKRAESEFLTGALPAAEERLVALSARAATTIERASITCLLADLYTTVGQGSRAIAVAREYLQHLGIDWPSHPTDDDARREYRRIWSRLEDRTIDEVVALPLMRDATSLATLDVLTKVQRAAFYTDVNLMTLVACLAVDLSLEFGNSDGSCPHYAVLGRIAGLSFDDYEAGLRLGQIGYELVEQRGLTRFQAHTYLIFQSVLSWTRHIRAGRELMPRAFEAAIQTGDLSSGAYCCSLLNTNLLAAGDHLDDVQAEAERGLAFARKLRFGFAADLIATQLALVRTLRGSTPRFGSFDDEQFDEQQTEQRFASSPDLAVVAGRYWIRKLQARFFAGDYAAALEASARAKPLLRAWTSLFETAEYHFHDALARAAVGEAATAGDREQHLQALVAHHRQIESWAASCPQNFSDRAALVGAEIARLDGRILDAQELYEQAIRAAQTHGFVHVEALAHELAGRCYATRGFTTIAQAYVQNARLCYARWGADGKVRQLDQTHPQLGERAPAPGSTGTIGAPLEHLDLATVIKVSQAVSGEIVIERLLHILMRTALEHAGAGRCLLIAPRGTELCVEAEATTSGDTVDVRVGERSVESAELPQSILQSVVRMQESVLVADASAQNAFSADPYIVAREARSVLCLPLMKQATLIGVLYLENRLASHVFTPSRIAVLKLLASQAAISLESTRLYSDLQQREAKIRRLVDSNIIGIVIWHADGRIFDTNDAFLHLVQLEREDLLSGRVRWTDLIPPEWHDRERRVLTEVTEVGRVRAHETEFLRRDGTRVPVLIGGASFEGAPNEGLAFVLDLSERKQQEREISALNERLMSAQEQERMRISGELHDGVMQEILGISLLLDSVACQIPDESDAKARLDVLRKRLVGVSGDIRRIAHNLHPSILEVAGLPKAVQAYCWEFSVARDIAVSCEADEATRELSRNAALALYRMLQEALGNAAKHAAAKQIAVRLARANDEVSLTVSDDGVGFDRTRGSGSTRLGLITIRERAAQLDGRCEVDSAPGLGTTIRVAIPFR